MLELKEKLKKKASVVFERKDSDGFWSNSARNSVTNMFETVSPADVASSLDSPNDVKEESPRWAAFLFKFHKIIVEMTSCQALKTFFWKLLLISLIFTEGFCKRKDPRCHTSQIQLFFLVNQVKKIYQFMNFKRYSKYLA